LRQFQKLASQWLIENAGEDAVVLATSRIERLYAAAGAHVEAFRLAGKKPDERARAAWARLREANVSPMRIVISWLALEMKLYSDPEADRTSEYRRVQAAKLVHRLASGTHKRWQTEGRDGRPRVKELHKYPFSRGQVLRHIGVAIEDATATLRETHGTSFEQLARAAT
jgi:hypothetical protein